MLTTTIAALMLSFISTKSSTVFHADDCRYATQIIERLDANTIDNVRIYADVNEAIQAGKRPCLVCDPMNFKAWVEASNATPVNTVAESNGVLPGHIAATLPPTVSAVCQHWLAGADADIPSGNGDWDANKIVDLRDFAVAANGDTDRLVIWGMDICDMWESNAIVNKERQCK